MKINRAPVLTLWAAVVAERLGFNHDEALTLGRAVAGLNAYTKGKSLGLFAPRPKSVKEKRKALSRNESVRVDMLGRAVPARRTRDGLRALAKDRAIDPQSVERYLDGKFGDALDDTRKAMRALARSRRPGELAEEAYDLYAAFRPSIPAGKKGWGAAGWLNLERIRRLAEGD
ncbi:MAG: hypothetical protein R3286_19325 [Gammaproteobacteria bacterium]|nr:hypothetical protein [Gammaproteobacteria bacterium]